MHRPYEKENIPTELLRALVACVDAGSVATAADALNLTRSALSAQIKRLQKILDGEVFTKSGTGLQLTERGTTVERFARRILAMNDQLLALARPNPQRQQFEIGMPPWIASVRLLEVIRACQAVADGKELRFRCENPANLARDLNAGNLDVAFLCNVTEPPGVTATEWTESMHWIKSRDLALDYNAPVPLVSWSGSMSDRVATKAFEKAGIPYSIIFSSPDLAARVAAATAGLGIMLITERTFNPELEIIQSSYLPPPPMVRSGVYVREGLDQDHHRPLLRAFKSVVRPRPIAIASRPAISGLSAPS